MPAGAVGATAGAEVDFFTAAFFFECFLTPVVEVAVSFEAGAGVVVAGAVCAKEIAANARVMVRAVMVFMVFVRVSLNFLCLRRFFLPLLITKTQATINPT